MIMDALLGRASSRFVFVTLLPNFALAIYVAGLLAAGAPQRSPSMDTVLVELNRMSWRDLAVFLLIVVVTAVAAHPLQTPLVQLLEGYWLPFPGGALLTDLAVRRHTAIWARLRAEEREFVDSSSPESYRRASSARFVLALYPDDDVKILPTSLGNALRAGEERAAARYGMNIAVVMPRIMSLLDAGERAWLSDRRTQLDTAVRLCVVSLLGVVLGLGLLVPTGHWLWVPFISFTMAWASYRGAVAAARSYCTQLASTIDLHHRDFWRALSLPVPATLYEERERASMVGSFLDGEDIDEDRARSIGWLDPPGS